MSRKTCAGFLGVSKHKMSKAPSAAAARGGFSSSAIARPSLSGALVPAVRGSRTTILAPRSSIAPPRQRTSLPSSHHPLARHHTPWNYRTPQLQQPVTIQVYMNEGGGREVVDGGDSRAKLLFMYFAGIFLGIWIAVLWLNPGSTFTFTGLFRSLRDLFAKDDLGFPSSASPPPPPSTVTCEEILEENESLEDALSDMSDFRASR